MATEAEARATLIDTSKNLLMYAIEDLGGYPDEPTLIRPVTGTELEDIIKKLFRVTQTLKTAQSLSTV